MRPAFDLASPLALLAALRRRVASRAAVRVKHLAWSALLALAMYAVFLLEPLDQLIWINQARSGVHRASGDIVLVETGAATTADAGQSSAQDLAELLRLLNRKGAGRIFVDLAARPDGFATRSAALDQALIDSGARVTLVDRLLPGSDGASQLSQTLPAAPPTLARVAFREHANYLGLQWDQPRQYAFGGKTRPSFAAALAGSTAAGPSFPIDYTIDPATIPTLSAADLMAGRADAALVGKTVVVGLDGDRAGQAASIPGHQHVSPSLVSIYGAETLKSGRTGQLGGAALTALWAALLAAAIGLTGSRTSRRLAYAAVAGSLLAALLLAPWAGYRLSLAYPAVCLAAYALFRLRARWQERAALFDPETGLPTLRALDGWIVRHGQNQGHVVVARIHGYEHVLRTLSPDERGPYTLRLADRLRAIDGDLAIHAGGHYFAWHTASPDTDALVDHLCGLRAMFAAPIQLGNHAIDVGVTFGVARVDGDPVARIAAATAAADETSEAIDPVKVASSGSDLDLLWDMSLRSRIDEAMEAGEIYCVYQPKIDIVQNHLIGVEALVRWHDPAKGFIPPLNFIRQCENAGRMEHLTRYVLQSACTAGKLLHFRGQVISMAVNISATLLVDMRICAIVSNVLAATGFDPRHLVLEVTETARITDYRGAAEVLTELKRLGARISMDDFGVGAANFETFFELPFDEIKLDRLFVGNAAADPKARAIVASVVEMGKAARIAVVAEGAETDADIALLREMGCRDVQGFALSRPLSLSNLLDFHLGDEQKTFRSIV